MAEPYRLPASFDEQGRLRVADLVKEVSPDRLQEALSEWIGLRLAGQDPYRAIDRDNLERPWYLFVVLLRRHTAVGEFHSALEAAVADALQVAQTDAVRQGVLQIVAHTQPATCWPLVRETAAALLDPPKEQLTAADKGWLRAAAAYPDAAREPLIKLWRAALSHGAYRAIAWTVIGRNLYCAMGMLPTMANQWAPELRDGLLRLHAEPLESADPEEVRRLYRRHRADFETSEWLAEAMETLLGVGPAPDRQGRSMDDEPARLLEILRA